MSEPGRQKTPHARVSPALCDMTRAEIAAALAAAPDADIVSEYQRRRSLQGGGRPPKISTCRKCGREVSARAKRKPCPHS